MLLVGIDPGVETGVAQWDAAARQLQSVAGMPILDAMAEVSALATLHRYEGQVCNLLVVFEDARGHHVRFGRNARKGAKILQGVGSVKRDCGMWEEFLVREGIPFVTIKPRRRATKKDAGLFKRITGWPGRTNEHGRDAAMFVYDINTSMAEAMVREWQQRRAA
jgi:hypothetical protein